MKLGALIVGFCSISATALAAGESAPDGAAIYKSKCAICHMADGRGTPFMTPPVRDVLKPFLMTDVGRDYLSKVIGFGMAGPIISGGESFSGAMPAFADELTPDEIAAVLNHLAARFNESETDLNAERVSKLLERPAMPSSDLLALRKSLLAKNGN